MLGRAEARTMKNTQPFGKPGSSRFPAGIQPGFLPPFPALA
jgi:hypothetical protein